MNAFTNISFRSEDGEKEFDLPPSNWREDKLAAQDAMAEELAARSGDDYVTADEIVIATHKVGDCVLSEKEKFDKSKASVMEAIKEIKPDCCMTWPSLKLWVARTSGLLG